VSKVSGEKEEAEKLRSEEAGKLGRVTKLDRDFGLL
jgi:hypothetical protein